MSNYRSSVLLCSLLLAFSPNLQSQSIEFDHITVESGLSNNSVLAIFQDAMGYVWIGTEDGLNRFDGFTFRTFHYRHDDSTSIDNNVVSALCSTSGDNFFAGTFNGINYYDADFEIFRRIPIVLNNQRIKAKIYRIEKTDNNLFLAATSEGLFYYNEGKNQFEIYLPNGFPESIAKSHITSVYVDDEGLIWVGSHNDGMHCYDPFRQKTIELTYYVGNKNSFRDNKIIHINAGSRNTIWIATNLGAYQFNKNTYQIRRFTRDDELTKKVIADKSVLFTFENNPGEDLWILTRNGLSIFDQKEGKFSHFFHEPFERKSLSGNVLNVAFTDKQGNIWIGTMQNGINLVKNHFFEFNNILSYNISNNLARNDFVLSVLEDKDQNIWIGTYGNGINVVDAGNGEHHNINTLNTPSLKSDHIQCMLLDSKSRIWVGTYLGGITLIDLESNTYKTFVNLAGKPNSLADDIVNHIFEDSYGRVWIATHKGISLFDSEKENFTNFKYFPGIDVSLSFANRITEDMHGNIWVSTYDNGIFRFNPTTEMAFRYFYTGISTGISDNTINTLYCDAKGRIWIGTFGGLTLYIPNEDSFVNFTKSDGLSDNAILSIIDDDRGNIWLGTNNSLTKFNPDIRSFTNFNKNDGLIHDIFQINAVHKNSSGTLYFGSKNGLVYFNANQIDNIKTDNAPTIHFTSLKIFDEYIKPGPGSVIEKPVNKIDKIRLKHYQSFITFGFSTFNFVSPFSERFSYFLEGYDYGWIDIKNSNALTYTRIPPGKYKLHVKATNTLSNVTTIKSIDLVVTPTFWRSRWSYIFYSVIVMLMIYIAYSYIKSRALYRQRLIIERFESEKNNEINQSKIRFFINVAHEFKTPLTLILSPLEKLIKQDQELDACNRLKLTGLVYRNAQILSRLVTQIMDLRRIDTGNVKLLTQRTDIITFLNELSEYFYDYAQNHGISFSLNSSHSSLMVWLDHEKAEKIFLNILSNAFKYTPDGNSVDVHITVINKSDIPAKQSQSAKEFVSVKITDTGRGIAPEYLNKIFDRFFQVSDSQIANPSSSGIGLSIVKEYVEMHQGFTQIESQPGQGTIFTIFLPIGDDHLQADEKISADLTTYKTGFIKQKSLVPFNDPNPMNNSTKTLKILVVEDNYELRNYIVESLNSEFDVYEAGDGEEGLKIALDVLPKLIVSDVMMPKMNGFDLCRAIKNDINISHIPVILLTVLDASENKIEGFDEGADDYLNKPFNVDVLRSRIKNIINTRETLKQRYLTEPDPDVICLAHSKTDKKFIFKANEIMQINLSAIEFTAEDFAREIGMSRSNLHIKMKALINQSTTEFIRTYRLKEAVKLLSTNDYNISEVAYMVGFNTISYFNRCFKKMYHVTPSEYVENRLKPQ